MCRASWQPTGAARGALRSWTWLRLGDDSCALTAVAGRGWQHEADGSSPSGSPREFHCLREVKYKDLYIDKGKAYATLAKAVWREDSDGEEAHAGRVGPLTD